MSRVVVAMSGGVDSSVAALLLHEAGHEVFGLFMQTGVYQEGVSRSRTCCSHEDARDAERVCSRLGIPFYPLNFKDAFDRLIGDFAEEYHRGRTPNPCIHCNARLKFGALFDYARALGADLVATGHYARVEKGAQGPRLLRARDEAKDQSYVLFLLNPSQLDRSLFPLGGLMKAEVRERARGAGLPVAEKAESMDICFVPDGDYFGLVKARDPERVRPGAFVDTQGRVVGAHEGHQRFTIGQRRIGVSLGAPAYVTAIDPATSNVTVGTPDDLLAPGLAATGVNWLGDGAPPEAFRARVKIRHRHAPAPATVRIDSRTARAEVLFDTPERAVTPGQAAVFYDGERVMGGGWVEKILTSPSPPS